MLNEVRPFEIVIAEDNPADVALVREALKLHKVNCLVHVMSDGERALTLLKELDMDPMKRPLDLLILDMHLPKHDGPEILKNLRSTEHYAQTPVIVMTSSGLSTIESDVAKSAPLFYFRKPSALDEFMKLGSVVAEVLHRHGNAGPQGPVSGDGGNK